MTDGGAMTPINGSGRLLTSSFPVGNNAWQVTSKDHIDPAAGSLSSYVIGVKSKHGRTPLNQIKSAASVIQNHPSGSVVVDSEYVLTGGGAQTQCVQGNLLTASYPLDQHTWRGEAKDHGVACPSAITVWAIGLQSPPGSTIVTSVGNDLQAEGAPGGPIFSGAMAGLVVGGHITGTPVLRHVVSRQFKTERHYVVQNGDSLRSLALKFYGNQDWRKLLDANVAVVNDPQHIPRGTVLMIP